MTGHHPSDSTLAAYAAGSLPEGLGLVVATHLSFCPACRAATRMVEDAGGQLLEEMSPVAMSPGAMERVLGRGLAAAPAIPPPVRQTGLPPPLDRCSFGRWWPLVPGLRFRPLAVGGRAWAGLLMVGPGKALPAHGHDGLELACVLRGSFVDGAGHYGVGDIAEPQSDHDDPPRVEDSEPCVCIIASEGFRLRGVLGTVQRMLGR